MKKILSISITLMLAFVWVSINAQWLWDLIDSLWSEINFWYTTNEKITIKEILEDKVIIQSPLIKTENSQNITKYTIMYSQFPLTEILENTELLNETKEKSVILTNNENPFSIELLVSDWLNPITKYYLFVIPKDEWWNFWEVSNEIWFNIAEKTYWDAWSSVELANIRPEINGNTITLKWIAIAWSTTIDISVMTPETSSFNRVATVNMNQEKYDFIASRNWEYVFKFVPENWGKEVNHSVQINTFSNDWDKKDWWTVVIPVVPKTWPTENILIIVITSFLWYIIYKKLYRKAK